MINTLSLSAHVDTPSLITFFIFLALFGQIRAPLSQLRPKELMNLSSDATNSSRKIAIAIPDKCDTTLWCTSIFCVDACI